MTGCQLWGHFRKPKLDFAPYFSGRSHELVPSLEINVPTAHINWLISFVVIKQNLMASLST